jgi:hypothetical protein
VVDDSRTLDVIDFDGVQLVSKDSCTRRQAVVTSLNVGTKLPYFGSKLARAFRAG